MINRFVILSTLIAVTGCDSQPSSRVVTEMRNITNDSVLNALPTTYSTGTANSAVLVESFKIPIMDIAISDNDEIKESNYSDLVYLCDSENESDCYVDLVSGFNENILPESSASVGAAKEALYTSMQLGTCSDGSFTAVVKAKVDLLGSVWYTQAGSSVLVTTGEYSATSIAVNQCTYYSVFSKPYVVGNRTGYLNLYFDLENIARGLTIDIYPDEQGENCSWKPGEDAAPSDPVICVELPKLIALSKSEALPELRRYRLHYIGDNYQSTILGLYIDAEGRPVGGYSRDNYSDAYYETPRHYDFKSMFSINDSILVTDFSGPGKLSVSTHGDNTINPFKLIGDGYGISVYKSDGVTLADFSLNTFAL